MKKRTVYLIIIVLILLFGYLYLAEPLELIGGVETDTQIWEKKIWLGCGTDPKYPRAYVDDEELLEDKIPTAWLPGAKSEYLYLGDYGFIPYGITGYGPFFGEWWWEVDFIENGVTHPVIHKSGYYDENYICDVSGPLGEQEWDDPRITTTDGLYWPFGSICDCGERTWYHYDWYWGGDNDGNEHFDLPTLKFKILGPHIGTIRVRLKMHGFVWSDDCWGVHPNHCDLKDTDIVLLEDNAIMQSGYGDIYIYPNPNAPPGPGTEYYFEEGDTLEFKVTTGYDGSSGDHWQVSLNNQYGNPVAREMYDEYGVKHTTPFLLPSGLDGKEFYYTIQQGDWVEGNYNDWSLWLHNSIIAYDKEVYYTLYEGGFDDIPGPTTITWLSGDPQDVDYAPGDTVSLRLEAEANIDSGRPISKFEVLAYYGNKLPENIEYHEFKTAVHEGGTGYSYYQTFSFILSADIGLLTIEGRAWDSMNLPGGTGYEVVYVTPEQNGFTLTVHVRDNMNIPVSGAIVTLQGNEAIGSYITEASGDAVFGNLPQGRYSVYAVKGGLGEDSTTISLSKNDELTLTLGFALDLVSLGIALLIFTVMSLFAWFAPIPPLHKKIVFILGVVLAVIVFLFLAGMLVWLG